MGLKKMTHSEFFDVLAAEFGSAALWVDDRGYWSVTGWDGQHNFLAATGKTGIEVALVDDAGTFQREGA